jgi:hypothetical protein
MLRSLLIALALLLPAPALAGRDVLREQSTRTLETAGLRGLRVENSRGDVQASASPDGRIHVIALKVVHANSRAESRHMADELHVDTSTEAGQLVVRARYPARRSIRIGFWDLFHDMEWPSSEVKIAVQVPAGLALEVRTSSGDVDCTGLATPVRIASTSGDVRIAAAGGDVEIETASGDVNAGDVGRIHVRTTSGDADLVGVRGPVDVHTTSGDVTVRDAADSLMLGTVSGDVEVEHAALGLSVTTTSGEIRARRVRGRVEVGASSGGVDLGLVSPITSAAVSTGSGDIELRFERGMSARLELQTSNGQLQMESPIQVLSLTRRRVTGQLRQGGAVVSLRSASGDIHVLTGEGS